ncbi:hypothetical protein KSP40_PGU013548 [Platanthera guangdongensis]|uniref:Uncharacterized protein n=1 Tax=Platanthera guangdongensis TaxID=2320717 RepID=A0ABR2MI53_9ASPA
MSGQCCGQANVARHTGPSCTIAVEIPPGGLKALSKLELLDLSGNSSSLPVSSALPLLPQLKELYLRKMKLSHIPSDILSLRSLRVLDLSQNLLVSVPEDIRNLTSLQELHLSDNSIAVLPPELGLFGGAEQQWHAADFRAAPPNQKPAKAVEALPPLIYLPRVGTHGRQRYSPFLGLQR